MNAVIVGAGFIAETHAQALTELGHRIIAVVSPNPAGAGAFARRWGGGKAFASLTAEALEGADCVHVCAPPCPHFEAVKLAISLKKHVICEKPLCLDPAEAKELLALARAAGVVHAVNFNVRFHEACRRGKALISTPEFGAVNLIHGTYLQEFHALPADYTWRYMSKKAGPMRATTEIGSHWIDLARYLTGLEITAVSARYGKFNPDRYVKDGVMYASGQSGAEPLRVDSEDAAAVTFQFSNGALGSMLLSEVSHGRSNRAAIEISGGKESMWWNSEEPYTLHTARRFDGDRALVNAFGGGFPDTFKAFFALVYRDVAAGKPCAAPAYPTFCDGYANSAVCDAIYQSAGKQSEWTEVTL